jgi:hypothetical protein
MNSCLISKLKFCVFYFEECVSFQIMSHISILCFLSVFPFILGQISKDPDQLLNWCLDGMHHKSKPGPEDELFDQVGVRLPGRVNVICWPYSGLTSLT